MADPSSTSDTDGDVEIACTLSSAEEMKERAVEWRDLLVYVRSRTEIEGGYRLDLAGDVPIDDVVRLANAEQSCCSFFSFAVTFDTRGTALEVRAPKGGQQILRSLFDPPDDGG